MNVPISDADIARTGKLIAAQIQTDMESRILGTFIQPVPPPENFAFFSYLHDPLKFEVEVKPSPMKFNPWLYGDLIVKQSSASFSILSVDCGEDYAPKPMSAKARRAGKNWIRALVRKDRRRARYWERVYVKLTA